VYNGHFFSTDGVMQLHTTICISNSDLSAYLNRFYILISTLTPDNLVRLNPLLLIHKTDVRNRKRVSLKRYTMKHCELVRRIIAIAFQK
jgi:hypothetical protein